VRTEQLEKAKNAAEAASRAKSAFLATMSHEIRTPMNGVLGMTEMLLGTALSDNQRNYTSMVKRSGEHLLVIINDILDFSKIEAGKLTIEYIHFNICDLLEEIDHAFLPQAQARGIAFEFDIADNIPIAVCGDPNRLRQVMSNLLGNAIKFTDHGRITARAAVVSENAQSVTLRFEVRDTGIGISREARHRIFEAFSQADNSTTRKYGGTGLGLAISKQLVELMGGSIGVDNAQPQGSIFWFTVSFDKRQVEPVEPGCAAGALDPIRVLLIDDDAERRAVLRQQLSGWKVQAELADAGDTIDRLQLAARDGHPFDLAILDMDLQRTSGLALAAAIDADHLTRPSRVVLVSSARCAADQVQRRQAGVAYQLIKPVRAGDLFECMVMRHGTNTPAVASTLASGRRMPAPAAARRRKVLLAEDNPVNVEVALAMLNSLNLDTTCVRNGQEALSAVRGERFDVVLMDCQMPTMDGFAATTEIRRLEQHRGHGTPLPIIAITANALQGDREACLAAGMDDYLSKPFTQQQLGAVIGRWLGVPLAAVAQGPVDGSEVRTVINRHALDNIRALSRERGDALVEKVIHAFVDDTPQQLSSLRQAIAGSDAGSLRTTAHSLKSSSANVGAEALARLCKEMERLAQADRTDGAAGILSNMEQEFQAVRHSLNAILEKET
jgi:two-component system sensor histidine kinase/response regulator